MRDVGPNTRPQLTSEARSHRSRPSPFQRDVGGLSSFDGGLGEGETSGGTQEVGGPCGAPRKRTTMEVVVRFRHLSSHPRPTDHPCAQRQRIK
jgi:hypothetical protein